jgi:hypothetical protein
MCSMNIVHDSNCPFLQNKNSVCVSKKPPKYIPNVREHMSIIYTSQYMNSYFLVNPIKWETGSDLSLPQRWLIWSDQSRVLFNFKPRNEQESGLDMEESLNLKSGEHKANLLWIDWNFIKLVLDTFNFRQFTELQLCSKFIE